MLPSPNFNQNYGGAALLGEGINQGVNNFMQNYLGMKRQKTAQQYADIQERQQSFLEGQHTPQASPQGQPEGQPSAVALAAPTSPIQVASGVQVGPPGSANYVAPGMGTPEPREGPASPFFQPANPQMAQAGQAPSVGAQALATQPPQAQAGPKPIDQMSQDELRSMAFEAGQRYTNHAMQNQNQMEMLQKAYHYKTLKDVLEPQVTLWGDRLEKARANPQDPASYRGVQELTGELDPDKATAIAANKFLELKNQYEQYKNSFEPLNQHLSSHGITPEMYGDEPAVTQLLNRFQFQPHTAGQMPHPSMRSPSTGGRR